MPISDSYQRLALSAIYIDRGARQRRQIITDGLADSIRLHGVLQPIIVAPQPDGRYRLIAGERRLSASIELGLPDIPVRLANTLSPIECEIIELEENIKRQDLPWQDLVLAGARIHRLHCQLDPSWTQQQSAEAMAIDISSLSRYLRIAREMHREKISGASTLNEAYNIINRENSRLEAEVLNDIVGPTPVPGLAPSGPATMAQPPMAQPLNPAKSILHESFLQWAPRYTGKPFNFIHCDFPFGINVFDGHQSCRDGHRPYPDYPDLHFRLLETLLLHFDRLASLSCHLMYWHSMQHHDHIRSMLAQHQPSLHIHPHPLIWLKSDNSGISPDPRRMPRHIYETALLITRNRPLVRVAADAYSAPTDRQWHVHTKPEPMLRHFFSMLVDEHTSLLDPTCGSGAALRAAESLGASRVLGMDTDEQTVGQARTALRHFRLMRANAKLAATGA